jgi:hypothetical protein
MFSDEIVNSSSVTVRRSKTMDRYADNYVVKTVKHSPSLMMWACFSGKSGREGGMYALPKNTTMNKERNKQGSDSDSIGSVDPDSESGSGSRRAKITHKSRFFFKFMF